MKPCLIIWNNTHKNLLTYTFLNITHGEYFHEDRKCVKRTKEILINKRNRKIFLMIESLIQLSNLQICMYFNMGTTFSIVISKASHFSNHSPPGSLISLPFLSLPCRFFVISFFFFFRFSHLSSSIWHPCS